MQYKKMHIYTEAKSEVEDFIEVMKLALERSDVNGKLFLFFFWRYENVLKMALKVCLFFGIVFCLFIGRVCMLLFWQTKLHFSGKKSFSIF